jgi:hypothetical protein
MPKTDMFPTAKTEVSVPSRTRSRLVVVLSLSLAAVACFMPAGTLTYDAAGTQVAATIFDLQTAVVDTQTALSSQIPTSAATDLPTITSTPTVTTTPQNPLVTALSLCWTGPGKAYLVVSSIRAGTRVELLGVGSVAGWYIVQNPVYHVRCWINSAAVQVDPSYSSAGLQVYNPPPTPGPKVTPGPSPTP